MLTATETLDQLSRYISKSTVINEKVSQWTVGMQIEHCLLGTRGICRAVANSEPFSGKEKKGLIRRLIFLTGIIPRGRGKAPEGGIPNAKTTVPELEVMLSKARARIQAAANADPDNYWNHFSFGVMKRDEALKFVAIHNWHHLKIISDMLAPD